jgi:sphingolipid delta-4 desaturase
MTVERTEFFWSEEKEPHELRRTQMLKKYGKDITNLFGVEPSTKYLGCIPVVLHLLTAYLVSERPWWQFLLVAYVIGGTCANNLFLMIHETTHNLTFKTPQYNDWFAIFVNIPIVIPFAATFKKYHYEHHRYQGWDGVDTDIPTAFEAKLFSNFFGKILFCLGQILFYAVRPMMVRPLAMDTALALNWVVVGATSTMMWMYWSPWCIVYLILSVLFAGALHPLSGHFIAEHYMEVFAPHAEQETFSYYGPLNVLAWNVGYHNEHHDFPSVPWTRLPRLRQVAPDFYNNLVECKSWPGTILRFMFTKVNLFNRMKRERDAWTRADPLRSAALPPAAAGAATPPGMSSPTSPGRSG